MSYNTTGIEAEMRLAALSSFDDIFPNGSAARVATIVPLPVWDPSESGGMRVRA